MQKVIEKLLAHPLFVRLYGVSYARVRYTIKSYKQRVCKKFFDNFLHAFFVRINE